MTDLYLRAPDSSFLDDAFLAAGLIGDDGEPVSAMICIDRIGSIPGATGYHANLRLLFQPSAQQISALSAISLTAPTTPFRMWA